MARSCFVAAALASGIRFQALAGLGLKGPCLLQLLCGRWVPVLGVRQVIGQT